MPSPRSFVPSTGNPMLPVLIALVIFFPAIMIGFPAYVYVTGGPVGQTIAIVLLLGVVGFTVLAIAAWSAHSIEQERRQLWSGNAWAVWNIPADEYRRFVREEQRRDLRAAIGLSTLFVGFTVFALVYLDDPVGRAIVASLFCGASLLMIITAVWRPATTDRTRDVRIGPQGIEAMGRYHHVSSRGHVLEMVHLHTGMPPHLVFHVWAKQQARSNRRQVLRIPIPEDRIEEARAIVERFAPTPPANETYPELLRRKRAGRETLLSGGAGRPAERP